MCIGMERIETEERTNPDSNRVDVVASYEDNEIERQ
jgi:hypothetical protein